MNHKKRNYYGASIGTVGYTVCALGLALAAVGSFLAYNAAKGQVHCGPIPL